MPRPRREPYIFKREDRPGTGWWAFLTGRQPRVPLHTHDEAEALARLAERIKRSRFPAVAASDLALAEAAVLTVARARAQNTPRTAGEIGLNLARVIEWCQARGIHSVMGISKTTVEDYKTERRQQIGQRTGKPIGAARVNRELDSWKRMLRTALEERQVGAAEALGWFIHLREPRPKPHHEVASRATVDKVLAKASPGYRDLFRLVIGSGLRDDEVRHLSLGDIEGTTRAGGTITVTPKPPGFCECHPGGWGTKSFRYRTLPISAATLQAARRFVALRPELQLDQRRVWGEITDACDRAGVKRLSLHPLRHACATAWQDAGVPIRQISAWLGHADLATTERYLGIADDAAWKGSLPW